MSSIQTHFKDIKNIKIILNTLHDLYGEQFKVASYSKERVSWCLPCLSYWITIEEDFKELVKALENEFNVSLYIYSTHPVSIDIMKDNLRFKKQLLITCQKNKK